MYKIHYGPIELRVDGSSMARQRLGQHFLKDAYWREQIAEAIGVSRDAGGALRADGKEAGYCWIEIGPGHGEMTEYLAGTGRRVCAIEVDENLAASLKGLRRKFPNLEVVHGDILESDLRALADGKRARIYGSLPYYITSPILHRLFEFADMIDEVHVVVQTEVAERMAAGPGSKAYGYLSVATQLNARPEVVLEIPRAAFQPPPEVSSTLVTLRLPGAWPRLREESLPAGKAKLTQEEEDTFLEFVKLCFAKKRKTLVNNLRERWRVEEVRGALAALELRADARAEQVSISGLAALYTLLRGPAEL